MRKYHDHHRMIALINDADWPDGFFVHEIGHSMPPAGLRVVNVLSPIDVLHFVSAGKGRYNGEEIAAGDGFLIRRNQSYTFEFDDAEPWQHYWIGLGGRDAARTLEEMGFPLRNHCFKSPYFPALIPEFERMLHEDCPQEDEPCRMLSFFYQVMARHLRTRPPVAERLCPAEQYVAQAVRFMEENYYEALDMEKVAQAVRITSRYLYKLFMRYKRQSPSEYLIGCRLEKSRILLRETDLTIDEVSRAVGYQQPGYFSTSFRRAYGLSPTRYRQSAE